MRSAAATVILALPLPCLAADLVVGFPDPNQVLTLAADTTVDGDIVLLNHARLNLAPGVTLSVTGSLYALADSSFTADHARLRFLQPFAYRSALQAWDRARVEVSSSTIDGAGYSFSVGLAGQASASWTGNRVVNGFATWGLFDHASAALADCDNTGEFLLWNDGALTIDRSRGVLFWIVLPAGAVADLALPAPGSVPRFRVGPGQPGVTGLRYSATLTDLAHADFAVMARTGSSGTFRGSSLRVAATYHELDRDVVMSGVANNASFADSAFSWGGIDLRFIDSSVGTWNVYAAGTTRLLLQSCVLGEIWSTDDAATTVIGSVCDGSGGYVNASGRSTMQFLDSFNLSQTTTREHGLLIASSSALMGFNVDATDQSIMVLVNTPTLGQPRARDAALIAEAAVAPVAAAVGDQVEVRGTSRVLHGPELPELYAGYRLEVGAGPDPASWLPLARADGAVDDGPLARWNTAGLSPGPYTLRLLALIQGGTPIPALAQASLAPDPCPADFNADGFLDFFDYADFVGCFEGGVCPGGASADFNHDGFSDFFDYADFIGAFSAGC